MRHLLILICLSSFAFSDLLRVWSGGHISDNTLKDKSTDYNAWVMVKHFLPLVPNARIERTSFEVDNTQISHNDAILYYNFLDNLFWITLDAGLGISKSQNTDTNPIGFTRARVQVPMTGLGGEVSVILSPNMLLNTPYKDISAKIDYKLLGLVLVDLSLEAGYKIYTSEKINKKYPFVGLSVKF